MGLYGRLYDITEFMHHHPGSPETLMDNAGADATHFFEDVGHSASARKLMKSLHSLAPAETSSISLSAAARWSTPSTLRSRCMLSSVVDYLREGRAAARLLAKSSIPAGTASVGDAGADGVSNSEAVTGRGGDSATQGTFHCSHCDRAFDPMEASQDGEAGAARREACSHRSGVLKIFRVAMRAEWCGFYSCCRKHVLLAVAP